MTLMKAIGIIPLGKDFQHTNQFQLKCTDIYGIINRLVISLCCTG
jgi:hypothetical protein